MTKHIRSRHSDTAAAPNSFASIGTKERERRKKWADRSFAGSAQCPTCGSSRLELFEVKSASSVQLQSWRCKARGCRRRWELILHEASLVLDEGYIDDIEWFDRYKNPPTFQIVLEDGFVRGVRMHDDCPAPERIPHFVVREYDKDGIDETHLSGVDEQGRDYSDHETIMLGADHEADGADVS